MSGTKRGPGCLAWGLTLAIAVAVLCCVGAAGGAGAGWFTSQPGEPHRVPLPAGFPEARYLPHVAVEEVAAALAAMAYECDLDADFPGDRPDLRTTDAAYILSCEPTEASGLTDITSGRITGEHDEEAGLRGITVSCRAGADQPENCAGLFGQAVDGVLVSHPEREQAASWVEDNLSNSNATGTIGDLELTIRHFSRGVELRIWAA